MLQSPLFYVTFLTDEIIYMYFGSNASELEAVSFFGLCPDVYSMVCHASMDYLQELHFREVRLSSSLLFEAEDLFRYCSLSESILPFNSSPKSSVSYMNSFSLSLPSLICT